MSSQYDEDEVVAEEVELPTVYAGDAFADDMEYVPDGDAQQFVTQNIPEVVANFLRHLHQAVTERSSWELHSLYENSFNKLTEKFFQKAPWPPVDAVEMLVGDDAESDAIFLILYKELYYRHIYAKMQPTLEDRFNSYANYCDLFNYILNNSSEPSDLELPNQWLWDIIDEFIYQFQAFCQFRSKTQNKTELDLETLKERPDVWNVLNVLNVLYSLIQKSRINEQLWVSKNGGDMLEAAGEFGSRPLYRMLGYFSVVGLLRVHCLLGDYTMALKTMENIELSKKGLFARVTACHITTYYYVGFSYMMMRRYSDAIKAFTHILLFVSRTKHYHTRSYQYEVISKKCEQMYALLVMAVTLMPQRIDENVHSLMREKYGDQLAKLQKEGEESIAVYEELFLFACPKFISPAAPRFEDGPNQYQAATQLQLRVFLDEVKQQLLVPTIRSYLKLYTTLRISKLASFLDKTPEEVRTELLVFKHKTRQRRWETGSVLDGEFASSFELDFYIKDDMIHILESKAGRRIGDWFIRHIEKFDDTIANLERKA
ncbi:Eukaryotic translation initiation factor 3 subunit L [Phlyctochytrium planicorne]|nr:Eukaryotic translation initiation factor 3 subunit L [Phlyctochytrium planicorne]